MATLDKVSVDLMVVLGTTTMPIHQVMRLSRGAIIELDATEADEVKVLANNLPIASGVVLDACQNTMRLRKVTTEDLFPFASQVDSGVAELIRKQEAGWSYVRAGE